MPYIWRVELLGWLRATRDEEVVSRFQTRQTACLLAYLALNAHRSHPREVLGELLWEDSDPAAAKPRLNQALSSLRRQFEPNDLDKGNVLISNSHSIQFNPKALSTDVGELELLAKTNEKGSTEERINGLLRASKLYRGDLMPGFYGGWIEEERGRVMEIFAGVLSRLASLAERSGDLELAAESANRLLLIDNLQEENHLRVIRLHGLRGQIAPALKQYDELARVLAEQFGDKPSPASRNLVEKIRQGQLSSARTRKGAAAIGREDYASDFGCGQEDRWKTHLPMQFTRFFGREDELKIAREMIFSDRVRIITLLGAGGCGKTRLAIEIANQSRVEFDGRVLFVSLAELSEPSEIPTAIMRAAGVREFSNTSSPEDAAKILSRWPRSLLVLDNFEHLIDGGPEIVREILAEVAGLQVLTSSRQRLNLEGETTMNVWPLAVSKSPCSRDELMAFASTRLFLDRAQAVRPDFQVTASNVGAIQKLCERLEGNPLALELAAAWAFALSPSQMLSSLEDRFSFLVSRRRDITSRHRSLFATIEWGFHGLSADLQAFFIKLAVFHGGCSAEGAAFICDDPVALDALAELSERSFVKVEISGEHGEARYLLLESLREFAESQLSEAGKELLQARHAEYFLNFSERAASDRVGPFQGAYLDRISVERENLLAALRWCCEGEDHGSGGDEPNKRVELGLRIAAAMDDYWTTRGPLSEGREFLHRLLGLWKGSPASPTRATALTALGLIYWHEGDLHRSQKVHLECLHIQRESERTPEIARSLFHLGITAYRLGDIAGCRKHMSESLDIYEQIGDLDGISRANLNMGNVAQAEGDLSLSKSYFDKTLTMSRHLNDDKRMAVALNNLGSIAEAEGQYLLAKEYFEECASIRLKLQDNILFPEVLMNLGTIASRRGLYDDALEYLFRATKLAVELGTRRSVFCAVQTLRELAYDLGDRHAAATFTGIVQRMAEDHQINLLDNFPGLEDLNSDEALASGILIGRSLGHRRALDTAFQWIEANLRTSQDFSRSL